MKETVAVALSGGIDSMMAAYLLGRQGFSVFGLHFTSGYGEIPPLHTLSRGLKIPVFVVDLREEFRLRVVDYFADTYRSGKTPNPCLVCNASVKFGSLLQTARRLGANRLATGHYAVVRQDETGEHHLLKGKDPRKDQSYFLAFLDQAQLASALFPLGDRTKSEIRQMAAEAGLAPATSRESQDVCFIRESSYSEFLKRHWGEIPPPGPIVDTRGRHLGEHQGLYLYTVGQRRGINCPAPRPYYVVRIEKEENRLVVGFKEDLSVSRCRVTHIHWINWRPDSPLEIEVKVRYRHRAVPARVDPLGPDQAILSFERPEAAVTPGQGAVFYRNNEVLGAGWIDFS